MTIRVLLVDDHELMREALRGRFAKEDEFEVVAEAGDGRAAVEQAAACRPDIVVMDIILPELSGVKATRRILGQAPKVKVVALSMHEEPHFVAGMLEAGASGYVVKGAAQTWAEVLRAARAALAGRTYLSPELAGAVYEQVQALAGHPELSAQEREVLRLISKGLTTAEIAKQVNLSPNTVNTYRKRIMKKLDLHSIAALTRYAISTGLTSL